MKVIILKNNLKNGLDAISGVVGGSNALPVLKNFLIETFDNKIKLTGTNLEIGINSFIPAKVVENGSITIPLSIFNSIIVNLKNERINLEVENNNLTIKTDNYQAKIQGIKKEEFPIIPQIKNTEFYLEIPNITIKDSLLSIINAAQTSELKPEISGILFDYQINVLKLAATDTFRLAEKTLYNTQFKSNIDTSFKTIIPLKTIQEVVKIFKNEDGDNVSIFFDQNQVVFKNENTELISRLISGEFPDYQSIIPQSTEIEISLNKSELINAVKLASSFTNKFNEIKIIAKEKSKNIEVFSSVQGVGENNYLIPAKIKGKTIEIVFNWRFFLDGLKNIIDSEEVFIGLNNDNKPVIVKTPNDTSCFYILMPIKAG
ncbi:DNA polymerase III subunit beta [Candidatus Wolfebacteria bacterium]|nr:DNA polymerase III subunit beta [Candidatus Wolfebacteria bacterium]